MYLLAQIISTPLGEYSLYISLYSCQSIARCTQCLPSVTLMGISLSFHAPKMENINHMSAIQLIMPRKTHTYLNLLVLILVLECMNSNCLGWTNKPDCHALLFGIFQQVEPLLHPGYQNWHFHLIASLSFWNCDL